MSASSPVAVERLDPELGRARLVAQGLITRPFATPADAVAAFGAMQGQDLPGALASVALRTPTGGLDAVIADLDAGRLVRGYPMRGTVFLMAADDVAWVSQLCNASALRAAERRRGQLGLTDDHLHAALEAALDALAAAPRGLARAELMEVWASRGIPTDAGRGYHVLAHLIGHGHLCFGPWNGRDQNVVAAASWLPTGTTLAERFNSDRIAAVSELLRRYALSHGPVTLRDFAWWTKLPLKEIRAAWSLLEADFEHSGGAEASIWRPGLREEVAALGDAVNRPLLLPGFDEFVLGYADRLFAMSAAQHEALVPGNNGVFRKSVVVGGQVVGLWRQAGSARRRVLEIEWFVEPTAGVRQLVEDAYAAFPMTR